MNTNDKHIHCKALTDKIPGWLTNELAPTERVAFDAHLDQCPDCQEQLAVTRQLWQRMGNVPTPEPGPQVRTQFYAMLESFEANEQASRSGSLAGILAWVRQQFSAGMVVKLAYSMLLLGIGVLAGYWIQQRQAPQVAYQERVDTLTAQVHEMREMMMLSLLENPSATERLRAVGYTKDINDVDSRVIDALLMTLNNDPNVNVRLVTLEALSELAQDARVREGLVQSLTTQESPLVQVALADVMVKLQEKHSLKPLRQLLKQEGINDLVKTKLEMTIRQLS